MLRVWSWRICRDREAIIQLPRETNRILAIYSAWIDVIVEMDLITNPPPSVICERGHEEVVAFVIEEYASSGGRIYSRDTVMAPYYQRSFTPS